MDTIDRFNTNLPAPVSANLPVRQDLTPALLDQAGTPGLQVNPRVILRGLSRHWWHILGLSLLVSGPIVFSILRFVEPTYEASSLLHVEPLAPELFAFNRLVESQGTTYLKTEVEVLTSDRVLEPVVTNALVVNLPMIKKSVDPKSDLRLKLKVGIVESTNLIRVSMELPNRDEAITIVQAVIDSYKEKYTEKNRAENRLQTESMKLHLTKLEQEIQINRDKLKDLYTRGKVAAPKPADRLNANNDDGSTAQPTFNKVTEDHVQNMMAGMVRTELSIIEAQSMLDVKREAYEAYEAKQAEGRQPNQQVEAQQLARVQELFSKDTDVIALKQEIEDTGEHLDRIKKSVRQPHDPARVAAQIHFDKLQQEYKDLWKLKYREILNRLTGPVAETHPLASIEELKQKIDGLRKIKEKQTELFKAMEVDQKATNSDTFDAGYLNFQLTSLLNREDQIKKHLEQLTFEASRQHFRVDVLNPATAPRNPSNNKQLKYMAAAPVGVMFMILGMFLLVEIKAERVADPDSLSSRVRSEVYALPPLPTARSLRKLNADDQIEQFIQRLDHLRFAVCGNPGELGKGRCVLITSAIGGEGKTTLAAQLAQRCGSAGMNTLLVDSDFRRASLCKLLDVPPEGPGLSDVLKNEATIDEVAIPVQGGTFYLLPAGTPIHDTSRLLQSSRFGQLISQLRQHYDLIIIDSPPVLPVPDALIMGRWADGAVIAARYDISRFPQVERARRQLDNAGIAVLGTVINGMRHSDSYYGRRYTNNRRRSNGPDSSNAI
jgi:polysaccharide biosynthesis transport protein